MSEFGKINPKDLDNHITGHGGEDQLYAGTPPEPRCKCELNGSLIHNVHQNDCYYYMQPEESAEAQLEPLPDHWPEAKTKPAKAICITEGCGEKREWKGLCRSCYGQAARLVKKQDTTWEELEELGLCIFDDKPFTMEFKKRKVAKKV